MTILCYDIFLLALSECLICLSQLCNDGGDDYYDDDGCIEYGDGGGDDQDHDGDGDGNANSDSRYNEYDDEKERNFMIIMVVMIIIMVIMVLLIIMIIINKIKTRSFKVLLCLTEYTDSMGIKCLGQRHDIPMLPRNKSLSYVSRHHLVAWR